MSSKLQIKASKDDSQIISAAHQIRDAVFINEQGIDPALEYDGSDEGAVHYVGYIDAIPVVTARATITDQGVHIQRVATVKSARTNGYASQLLTQLMTDFDPLTSDLAEPQFYLGAQLMALPFYKRLGFQATGPVFMEAGIQHQLLILKIKQ
ncbi:GNAT family N-acetyltransferase [Lentilactobacillus senioris]|uniref:GNAT family N-acetyltransferase n=1 Tax=Lentilactobacillus senioris TaxID=931534 RepID=UPI0022821BB9|nr:GNAT family N-acetyltransferase [Lentilactobacillus senioris]MCY9806308.1 GNAT family N-acetyltransferase [Lentilactobacillus senioris]